MTDQVLRRADGWLPGALGLAGSDSPFPWQRRLLRRFIDAPEELPRLLDIPTGLGKTSVMAIWLVARASGAALPRRLVYVVDRRAVVDQATDEALRLRAWVDKTAEVRSALGLSNGRKLPVSTLRGQLADNREWLEDPSIPAIIVGTVDMVGSRLLFEGYGISRKMRPYHAGLLGADTLLVLDEAHLVPPFAHLVAALAERAEFAPEDPDARHLVPPFKVLNLTATGRAGQGAAFRLEADDYEHPVVKQRLKAKKHLTLLWRGPNGADDGTRSGLVDTLVMEARKLAGARGENPRRVIVYCNSRRDAMEVADKLNRAYRTGRGKKAKVEADVVLFVGERRVYEREQVRKQLAKLGFLPARSREVGAGGSLEYPALVVATSAAEVGVDLDAEHMVCDLVSWERMVQRLGRVNRRGMGAARVVVVPSVPGKSGKKGGDRSLQLEHWAGPLLCLRPAVPEASVYDASPEAILELTGRARVEQEVREKIGVATSLEPARPPLSRALVDAWAMTSLEDYPARPHPDPWLRGWVEDPPQVALAWRRILAVRSDESPLSEDEIKAFFEAAPMHLTERLEAPVHAVVDWLKGRTKRVYDAAKRRRDADGRGEDVLGGKQVAEAVLPGSTVAILLPVKGRPIAFRLEELAALHAEDKGQRQRIKARLNESLPGAQLFLDARFGGLSRAGLLDPKADDPPTTADVPSAWLSMDADERIPVTRWRVRIEANDGAPAPSEERQAGWRERLRLVRDSNEDGEPTAWIVIEKWRHDGATEEDRSASSPQLLDDHLAWVEQRAVDVASRLALPSRWRDVLVMAAQLHDLGKASERWQRAFHAPADGVYAKTKGPIDYRVLDGYRHEVGSLLRALQREQLLDRLDDDQIDLVLHLVAAHHGFARPLVPLRSVDDHPPSVLRNVALDVARRFVRLHRRWGPWGLAWWEALLRAADQIASRDNECHVTQRSRVQ